MSANGVMTWRKFTIIMSVVIFLFSALVTLPFVAPYQTYSSSTFDELVVSFICLGAILSAIVGAFFIPRRWWKRIGVGAAIMLGVPVLIVIVFCLWQFFLSCAVICLFLWILFSVISAAVADGMGR